MPKRGKCTRRSSMMMQGRVDTKTGKEAVTDTINIFVNNIIDAKQIFEPTNIMSFNQTGCHQHPWPPHSAKIMHQGPSIYITMLASKENWYCQIKRLSI